MKLGAAAGTTQAEDATEERTKSRVSPACAATALATAISSSSTYTSSLPRLYAARRRASLSKPSFSQKPRALRLSASGMSSTSSTPSARNMRMTCSMIFFCQVLALLGRAHGKRSYLSSVGRSLFMSARSAKPLDAPLAFPHADQRNVQDATCGGKNKKAGKVFPRQRNEAAR